MRERHGVDLIALLTNYSREVALPSHKRVSVDAIIEKALLMRS